MIKLTPPIALTLVNHNISINIPGFGAISALGERAQGFLDFVGSKARGAFGALSDPEAIARKGFSGLGAGVFTPGIGRGASSVMDKGLGMVSVKVEGTVVNSVTTVLGDGVSGGAVSANGFAAEMRFDSDEPKEQ